MTFKSSKITPPPPRPGRNGEENWKTKMGLKVSAILWQVKTGHLWDPNEGSQKLVTKLVTKTELHPPVHFTDCIPKRMQLEKQCHHQKANAFFFFLALFDSSCGSKYCHVRRAVVPPGIFRRPPCLTTQGGTIQALCNSTGDITNSIL